MSVARNLRWIGDSVREDNIISLCINLLYLVARALLTVVYLVFVVWYDRAMIKKSRVHLRPTWRLTVSGSLVEVETLSKGMLS